MAQQIMIEVATSLKTHSLTFSPVFVHINVCIHFGIFKTIQQKSIEFSTVNVNNLKERKKKTKMKEDAQKEIHIVAMNLRISHIMAEYLNVCMNENIPLPTHLKWIAFQVRQLDCSTYSTSGFRITMAFRLN